jgi:hypothetical protein
MKGIVFNLLQQAVEAEYGETTWEAMLDSAGVDGAYTSLGSYPDEELGQLVDAASSALDTPHEGVVRWFGRVALPMLAEQYSQFFDGHTSARSFMLTLNDIIHPEVRKLYPGAGVPEFDFDTSSDEILTMGYSSQRKLCSFGEGLVEGAAAHYGEAVAIDQPRCMNRGDERCLLKISFSPQAAVPSA